MSLSLFEIYSIVCAFLLGTVGIWRLAEAFSADQRESFEVFYGAGFILSSLASGAGFMVGLQGFYFVLLITTTFPGCLVIARLRAEADSYREQYRKFIELGVTAVTWLNLAIEFTQMNEQWWISLLAWVLVLWAFYSLIYRADKQQQQFQADSKKRDGDTLDHTGREHDTDTV